MRVLPSFFLTAMLAAMPAGAQEPFRIGVSVPLSGPYELLGNQIIQGANAARASLAKAGAVELVFADDHCSAEGGRQAAARLAEKGVQAVFGYLCTAALTAALPAFRDKGLPVMTLGARALGAAREARQNGDALFRLGPDGEQEAAAVADLLLPLWRRKNFAIIDDGTIHARELAESFRLAAETKGLKPAFVDTFRPALENQIGLVNRLKKSGATHVFAGGDRDDIAILARDAKLQKYPLTIAGGEALAAAPGDVPMPDGVLMVGIPEVPSLKAAKTALDSLPPGTEAAEGYFLPAFAAVQIISNSMARSKNSGGASLAGAMRTRPHDTVLGPVRFNADGDLLDNPYRLLVSKSGNFQNIE